MNAALRWAWLGIVALIIFAPLGLLAPGTAWGEWGREELQSLGLGYIPAGFDRFAGIWTAPLARYNLPVLNDPTIAYILSAVLGVALIVGVLFGLGWLLDHIPSREESRPTPRAEARPIQTEATHNRGRSMQGFIEKTLAGVSDTLEQTLFAEEIARQPGLLQSLDPRVKVLGTLAFLVAVTLSHNLIVILLLYLLTLPIARASHVPLSFYLKRVWLFMPFFTGIIAIPAVFNVFTPGPALVTLIDSVSPRLYLAITQPGVITAAFLLLRVGASVSVAVLLILTTRWALLLKALRVLRVPQAFVLILGMTYRYIYVLLHSMNDMFLARKSRVVGHMSGADDRRWLAAGMGTLLARSYQMSDEVYLAMQSRGFRGEAMIMDEMKLRSADWLWLALVLFIALLAAWIGR